MAPLDTHAIKKRLKADTLDSVGISALRNAQGGFLATRLLDGAAFGDIPANKFGNVASIQSVERFDRLCAPHASQRCYALGHAPKLFGRGAEDALLGAASALDHHLVAGCDAHVDGLVGEVVQLLGVHLWLRLHWLPLKAAVIVTSGHR